MNDVKVFEKSELGSVRVVGTKEQPLFCLRDVCDVLGIAQTKDIKASIIKEFDKDGDLIPYPIKTAGGTQQATFITEPQLYFVLMRSDKPKAKPFRQWVMDELIPKIKQNNSLQIINNKETVGNYFSFNNLPISIINRDGEPWFVAKEVCAVLEHTNHRAAIQNLDEDEKGVSKVYTLGGEQEVSIISESGLYALIIRSNKPQAKVFRKWVTSVVLPAIRKTGSYDSRTPKNMVEALELALEQAKQIQALNSRIEEDKPKVEFFDAVADSKDAISIGEVAKTLNMGIGRNRLFEILRNKSILQTNNIPYQKYIDAGYFRVIEQKYTRQDGETHISLKTLVYQKGLNYIRRVVEQEQSKGEI